MPPHKDDCWSSDDVLFARADDAGGNPRTCKYYHRCGKQDPPSIAAVGPKKPTMTTQLKAVVRSKPRGILRRRVSCDSDESAGMPSHWPATKTRMPSHWPLTDSSPAFGLPPSPSPSVSSLAASSSTLSLTSSAASSSSRSSAKRVRFPSPSPSTSVRTRPRTEPGEVRALFYSAEDVLRFKREYRRLAAAAVAARDALRRGTGPATDLVDSEPSARVERDGEVLRVRGSSQDRDRVELEPSQRDVVESEPPAPSQVCDDEEEDEESLEMDHDLAESSTVIDILASVYEAWTWYSGDRHAQQPQQRSQQCNSTALHLVDTLYLF